MHPQLLFTIFLFSIVSAREGLGKPAVLTSLAAIEGCSRCANLARNAGDALLATAGPCSQQEEADQMIELGGSENLDSKTKDLLVSIAVEYRQAQREVPTLPDGTERNSLFCQQQARSSQLRCLMQKQDSDVVSNLFFDPSAPGDGTVNAGKNQVGTIAPSFAACKGSGKAVKASDAGAEAGNTESGASVDVTSTSDTCPSDEESGGTTASTTENEASSASGDPADTVSGTGEEETCPSDSEGTGSSASSSSSNDPTASASASASVSVTTQFSTVYRTATTEAVQTRIATVTVTAPPTGETVVGIGASVIGLASSSIPGGSAAVVSDSPAPASPPSSGGVPGTNPRDSSTFKRREDWSGVDDAAEEVEKPKKWSFGPQRAWFAAHGSSASSSSSPAPSSTPASTLQKRFSFSFPPPGKTMEPFNETWQGPTGSQKSSNELRSVHIKRNRGPPAGALKLQPVKRDLTKAQQLFGAFGGGLKGGAAKRNVLAEGGIGATPVSSFFITASETPTPTATVDLGLKPVSGGLLQASSSSADLGLKFVSSGSIQATSQSLGDFVNVGPAPTAGAASPARAAAATDGEDEVTVVVEHTVTSRVTHFVTATAKATVTVTQTVQVEPTSL
ncbi:hypothetical protein BT69DRAFT_1284848 [Atractiella rhizophila]|nr:hypothetical protein BT69DRAFT_1284848 [Atractiella rhizophila]